MYRHGGMIKKSGGPVEKSLLISKTKIEDTDGHFITTPPVPVALIY